MKYRAAVVHLSVLVTCILVSRPTPGCAQPGGIGAAVGGAVGSVGSAVGGAVGSVGSAVGGASSAAGDAAGGTSSGTASAGSAGTSTGASTAGSTSSASAAAGSSATGKPAVEGRAPLGGRDYYVTCSASSCGQLTERPGGSANDFARIPLLNSARRATHFHVRRPIVLSAVFHDATASQVDRSTAPVALTAPRISWYHATGSTHPLKAGAQPLRPGLPDRNASMLPLPDHQKKDKSSVSGGNPIVGLPNPASYDYEPADRPSVAGVTPREAQNDVTDPLIISEAGVNLVHDCSGKDVTIAASNSKLILNGTCRSVTIPGNNDDVLVEISGNGKLVILGAHNSVIWNNSADGPEPMVVNADGSNTVIHLRSKSKINVPQAIIEAARLASRPAENTGTSTK